MYASINFNVNLNEYMVRSSNGKEFLDVIFICNWILKTI